MESKEEPFPPETNADTERNSSTPAELSESQGQQQDAVPDVTVEITPEEPPEVHAYPFTFTGTGGEYFRIWIVNLFLTIITLGIYGAWAKVRTRKYFYRNTWVDNEPFDYLAHPVKILKGYIIITVAFILFSGLQALSPELSIIGVIIFYILMPYLVYKSLRFNAKNLSYRNIRFVFRGTLKESFEVYLGYLLLVPVTLGLMYPYWVFAKKKYLYSHMGFGTSKPTFYGQSGPFYKWYLGCWGVSFLGMIVFGVVATFVISGLGDIAGMESGDPPAFLVLIPMLIYVVMLVAFTSIKQYLVARTSNYSWEQVEVDHAQFESVLSARKLLWIQISNVVAILFSLGLLTPWAKVRRTKYMIECLTLVTPGTLSDFTADITTDEAAIGDAATDFFDFDFGL